VEYGSGRVWQAYRPLGLAKEARFALLKIFGGLFKGAVRLWCYHGTSERAGAGDSGAFGRGFAPQHRGISKRVQAQWVEVIMDSLLPVSFLIPFSVSSQGNVESFMGSWFLDWMFTTNK